jgi:hypothetical protein
MKRIRKITAGLVGVVACTGAIAQGSLNFDEIPGIDQQPIVRVDINSIAIGFLKEILRFADPATADMLEGLRGIKLRVYHAGNDEDEFSDFISTVATRLDGSGWQQIMAVQDAGANVSIHMQMTEDAVSGMTFMAFDGEEAVFINIDGTINAADLGQIMAGLNLPDVLGSMPPIPPSAGQRTPVNGDN